MLSALEAKELIEFANLIHKRALKGDIPRPQTASDGTSLGDGENNSNFIV